MSRFCPLFSSSSGNSSYIGTSHGGILVDAGASCKGICEALERAGGNISDIGVIAVTHEHIDHIKSLSAVIKKSGAMLVASSKTLETLSDTGKIPVGTRVQALDGGELEIYGTVVSRFATSHDCDGSSGYSFLLPDGRRISVCTDLGIVTDTVRRMLSGSDLVLFESNHDITMLKKGPYPPQLKLRIMSDTGHISNNACSAELPALLKSGVTRFILGHLSQHNNLPMLAENAAVAALVDIGAERENDYILKIAAPGFNEVAVL